MGLFDFFGKKTETTTNDQKQIPWIRLTHKEQLEEIEAISKTIPVAIFKHSTSCGISRMVLRNFENDFDIDAAQLKLYYLDLLAFRDVSNEVGYKFQVIHQSPQLLVIKNGITVYHASHHNIHAGDLERYL